VAFDSQARKRLDRAPNKTSGIAERWHWLPTALPWAGLWLPLRGVGQCELRNQRSNSPTHGVAVGCESRPGRSAFHSGVPGHGLPPSPAPSRSRPDLASGEALTSSVTYAFIATASNRGSRHSDWHGASREPLPSRPCVGRSADFLGYLRFHRDSE
jgi:hypothetical protein